MWDVKRRTSRPGPGRPRRGGRDLAVAGALAETAVQLRVIRNSGPGRIGAVMTQAPETTPASARALPAAVAAIRASGLRVSAARRVVLEALFAADGPVTADELAAGIPGQVPESDLASVYRNLETLEQIGLVQRLQFGHGAARYALSGRAGDGFVYCHRCGGCDPLPAETLDALRDVLREHTSYEPRLARFPLAGLCAECRDRGASVSRPGDHL
jgi:Fur family ferric uptake transcriptional regulator